MTPERLSQVESKLSAACLKANLLGQNIGKANFGVYCASEGKPYQINGEVCCPMGALLLGTTMKDPYIQDAADILGIETPDVWEFIYGFDGSKGVPTSNVPMRLLGARFRKRLVTHEPVRC